MGTNCEMSTLEITILCVMTIMGFIMVIIMIVETIKKHQELDIILKLAESTQKSAEWLSNPSGIQTLLKAYRDSRGKVPKMKNPPPPPKPLNRRKKKKVWLVCAKNESGSVGVFHHSSKTEAILCLIELKDYDWNFTTIKKIKI